MRVLTAEEFKALKPHIIKNMMKTVFIYPTDTVYGIGCNAFDGSLIDRIRELKRRPKIPFSVIAPSKEWIREYCVVDDTAEEWLNKLPGPYTLILPVKKPEEFPLSLNNGLDTLGVRIPDHWFSRVVNEMRIPIVTTSANITGENIMVSLNDIPKSWERGVEYCIFEGEITGRPSTLVHLYDKIMLIKR